MKYNPDIHKRRSIRLKEYDYSQEGAYFVTICARNRECIFSEMSDAVGAGLAPAQDMKDMLRLTTIGRIIEKHWRNIPNEYQNADIDEFVIMPNHFHGILLLRGRPASSKDRAPAKDVRAPARDAPTLGDIIGSFKSECVNNYLQYVYSNNVNDIARIWQRNYYEHVIRNEKELYSVRRYIRDNPLNWLEDADNPVNIL